MKAISKNSQIFSFLLSSIVLVSIWGIIYKDALIHMVTVWSQSESYKHCFFIPVIVAYLIYEKKEHLSVSQCKPVWWLVFPLFAGQIGYSLVSELGINILMHVSAYLTLVIIVWSLLGHKQTRIILFPLLYLGFSVPVGEQLVPFLQTVTADLSVWMLQAVNIPVYREGLYIYLPNGTFHVAEACAGVRFLIGTFAIGVLLAYLNYQKIWKRVAFIIFCAFVPVLANGVRAFGIMVIGYLSDMKYATGADHLVYGWFFFAFVTVLIFAVGMVGNDKAPKSTALTERNECSIPNTVFHSSVLATVLFTSFIMNQLLFGKTSSSTANDIPFDLLNENFSTVVEQPHSWAAPTQDMQWQGVINGINVRLIYVDEASFGKELVSTRHRVFDNERWTQKELSSTYVNGAQVNTAEIVNIFGTTKNLASWYQVSELQSASATRVKLQQLLSKLSSKSSSGYFVVVEYVSADEIEDSLIRLKSLPQ